MATGLLGLAVLMFAVTYPARAVGLLAPGMDRLPRWAIDYLRLMGPAVLSALAAVNVLVLTDPNGRPVFHVGVEAVAVVVCLALVAWRRNLLVGLICAVALVVAARALGLAPMPG